MNTILRHAVILLALLLVSASCSNRLTLTKRHYNKGYYFAKSSPVKAPKSQKSIKENSTATARVSKEVVTQNITLAPKNEKALPEVAVTNVKTNSGHSKKANGNLNTAVAFQEMGMYTERPRVYNRHTFSLDASKEQSSEDDARSLFWIVVVVLIVLWALGFISGGFGLGILFNLLLVIALVLLILWLLRVI